MLDGWLAAAAVGDGGVQAGHGQGVVKGQASSSWAVLARQADPFCCWRPTMPGRETGDEEKEDGRELLRVAVEEAVEPGRERRVGRAVTARAGRKATDGGGYTNQPLSRRRTRSSTAAVAAQLGPSAAD